MDINLIKKWTVTAEYSGKTLQEVFYAVEPSKTDVKGNFMYKFDIIQNLVEMNYPDYVPDTYIQYYSKTYLEKHISKEDI